MTSQKEFDCEIAGHKCRVFEGERYLKEEMATEADGTKLYPPEWNTYSIVKARHSISTDELGKLLGQRVFMVLMIETGILGKLPARIPGYIDAFTPEELRFRSEETTTRLNSRNGTIPY